MQRRNGTTHGAISIKLDARFRQARRAERHLPGTLEGLQNPGGIIFALLDIRLVKGIDRERCAGQCRGCLPFEEFGAQLHRGLQPNLQEGGAALFERAQDRLQHCLIVTFEQQSGGNTSTRQHIKRRRNTSGHRDNFPLLFAGALGNKLLDPVPQRHQLRRAEQDELVVPSSGGCTQQRAQLQSRIGVGFAPRTADGAHFDGTVQHGVDVHSPKRRGH